MREKERERERERDFYMSLYKFCELGFILSNIYIYIYIIIIGKVEINSN